MKSGMVGLVVAAFGIIAEPFAPPTAPSGFWESADSYIYYTEESAVFNGEESGVAYFETADGNVWAAYVYDSDLQVGESVMLTFENSETAHEFYSAQEYGWESVTRSSARIVSIE